MKIVKLSAVLMPVPVPKEKRRRTDLGTKVRSDATLIRVETTTGSPGRYCYPIRHYAHARAVRASGRIDTRGDSENSRRT